MQHPQERELLEAARRGDNYEVDELLEEADPPVDVDVCDADGWTPLMWAASNGHHDVVANLLVNCAEFDVHNARRETPLILAASNGHDDVMEQLLESGAYADEQDVDGATAFVRAAQNGHVDAIGLLWSYHARVSIKDGRGRSALFLAAVNNHVDVVKELLSLHESVDTLDNAGFTPLMAVLAESHASDCMEMVQLLLKTIEDVDAVDREGRTALMVAAASNRVQATVALLDKGANSSLRSKPNKTALDIARECRHHDVAQVLEEHARMNVKKLILFFDGGARGNPGPGGAGAVLVEVFPFKITSRILYIGSIALNDENTTSNIAEYQALRTGLEAAMAHGYKNIHVVGDSESIVEQMKNGRVPHAPHLIDVNNECRSYAKEIGVCSWTHHGRLQNAMADAAANWAMNERHSTQLHLPDTSSGLASVVAAHLKNDLKQYTSQASVP